jgi:organic hydroperoxide reductase OsmC/OhrA
LADDGPGGLERLARRVLERVGWFAAERKGKTDMHTFQVETVWRRERECRVSARRNPDLTVATPPEFGGPERTWSPEELLVASVGSCLLSTFLYFAHRFELPFESYSSTSTGTMEKTSQGLRFTGIDVSIAVTVSDDEAVERASSLRLKERLEKYCPVLASLNCPVRLVLQVTQRAEQPGDGTQA